MLDHVSLRVADFQRALAFYRAALAPIGYQVAMEFPSYVGLEERGKPSLWITLTDKTVLPPSHDFAAHARQACEEMTKPANARTVAPKVIAVCWCQLHDQARAKQAMAKITSSIDRDAATRACANLGIELK